MFLIFFLHFILNRNFYADSTFSTYKDHLILAADGSDINIPTTAETLKLYGSASRKNTKPQAQIGLGCIYDVMNRMILESDSLVIFFISRNGSTDDASARQSPIQGRHQAAYSS